MYDPSWLRLVRNWLGRLMASRASRRSSGEGWRWWWCAGRQMVQTPSRQPVRQIVQRHSHDCAMGTERTGSEIRLLDPSGLSLQFAAQRFVLRPACPGRFRRLRTGFLERSDHALATSLSDESPVRTPGNHNGYRHCFRR